LATVGITNIPVITPPIVAILSTGDELVNPDQSIDSGMIRDSNRSMLLSALQGAGYGCWSTIDLGIAKDTQEEISRKIYEGLDKADVLITSGGVSMGELDLIKPLLERQGCVHFGKVLMKPGKPLTFATVQRGDKKKLIFGLPGNPVSSIVTFYLVCVPALRKLSGFKDFNLPTVDAIINQSLKLDPERPEYHRATVHWSHAEKCFVAESTGNQASSRLLSMRTANALLILPQAEGQLEPRSFVKAILINPL